MCLLSATSLRLLRAPFLSPPSLSSVETPLTLHPSPSGLTPSVLPTLVSDILEVLGRVHLDKRSIKIEDSLPSVRPFLGYLCFYREVFGEVKRDSFQEVRFGSDASTPVEAPS